MRTAQLLLFTVAILFGMGPVTRAQTNLNSAERHALVIGNQGYPKIPLDKPIQDGKNFSASLKKVGFKVTERYDVGREQMRGAIESFSRGLPKGSVALLFFAGHGVQVSGKNFLLPTDYGDIKTAEDFVKEMVNLDDIVATMSLKSGLNIVILDACRNNPTGLALPVKVEEGLAPFKSSSAGGNFIAYSTSPHATALDDSPYIRSLARNILINPGRIEDIFIKTRIDVENETRASQIPWESASLKTIFYFSGTEDNKMLPPPKIAPRLHNGGPQLQAFSFVSPVINAAGRRVSITNGSANYFLEHFKGSEIEMVEISGGEFRMGSTAADVEKAFADTKKYKGSDDDDEEPFQKTRSKDFITSEMPRHRVAVPGFFMSKHEITQGQYRSVMGSMPAGFRTVPAAMRGDNLPVISVTWAEANRFCEVLSETGRFYRLPSEAEWEYAARAGKDQNFGFGDNINSGVANYFAAAPFGHDSREQNRLSLLPAGSLNTANPFGLFDMHGNVAEWTADFWHDDYSGAPTDGSSRDVADEENLPHRVIRGGGWDSIGNDCRSAARRKHPAVVASPKIGFRVVWRQ